MHLVSQSQCKSPPAHGRHSACRCSCCQPPVLWRRIKPRRGAGPRLRTQGGAEIDKYLMRLLRTGAGHVSLDGKSPGEVWRRSFCTIYTKFWILILNLLRKQSDLLCTQRLAALTNMVQPSAPTMSGRAMSGSKEIVQGGGGATSQRQRSRLGPLAPGAGVSSSSMCIRLPLGLGFRKQPAVVLPLHYLMLNRVVSSSSSLCACSTVGV